jgi:hypothetical protein
LRRQHKSLFIDAGRRKTVQKFQKRRSPARSHRLRERPAAAPVMARFNIISWLIVHLGTLVLRLWFAACRVKIAAPDLHRRFVLGPEPVVGATWHRNAILKRCFKEADHEDRSFGKDRHPPVRRRHGDLAGRPQHVDRHR